MGYAKGKSVVGLDIEPGYVAAVETRPGQVKVERAASAPLPAGIVRDGEVVDVETLASSLRDLFAEHKLGRRVRLGVANQRIVMRTLDLPPLKGAKEINSAIRFQASDHIPMPLEQAVLEHHSLGIIETPDGPRTRVVVVAARRDMIERLLDATRKAGLRPVGIDLSAFAMIRALYRPELTGATLYTSVGGPTHPAIGAIAGELAERRALTLEHAHGWLRHVGLLSSVDEVEGDADIVLEAREVLTDGVRRIADEVRNSLDFLSMQDASAVVERVVLTGPAVAVPGFPEQLGEQVGLPLEVGIVQESQPGGFGGIDAGRLAVAAGLTVEEIPS